MVGHYILGGSMFDRDLFLQIAKEVDVMKIIFEPFNKSIEDMLEKYIKNNKGE